MWFWGFFSAVVMPYVHFALAINEAFYKVLHSILYALLFCLLAYISESRKDLEIKVSPANSEFCPCHFYK